MKIWIHTVLPTATVTKGYQLIKRFASWPNELGIIVFEFNTLL